MAMTLASTDLGASYNEISNFCNLNNEPVFITKNGTDDLVMMSNVFFKELYGRREFHKLIDEGLEAMQTGKGRQADEVFAAIRKDYGIA